MNVLMGMIVRQMNIELRSRDGASLLPRDVQMVFAQSKLPQLVLEGRSIHAQIQQGADKHVAADATEDIEVKCFHE